MAGMCVTAAQLPARLVLARSRCRRLRRGRKDLSFHSFSPSRLLSLSSLYSPKAKDPLAWGEGKNVSRSDIKRTQSLVADDSVSRQNQWHRYRRPPTDAPKTKAQSTEPTTATDGDGAPTLSRSNDGGDDEVVVALVGWLQYCAFII